ncbi:hypothetical protein C0991_001229 [Blastosporella zonata]|nr:hypothetical protein C0991_001229 [Blastosporella zonata]
MPGKHVRFDVIPSTPQFNYSSSSQTPNISPPPFNQSGVSQTYSPLPPVASHINPAFSAAHGSAIVYDIRFPTDNASLHHSHINDLATEPPLPCMTITCASLEGWAIRVEASQPGCGVTILDVMHAIWTGLRASVTEAEYRRLSPEMRRRVDYAFHHRYQTVGLNEQGIAREKAQAMEKSKGLKRVDFLGEMVLFRGFQSTLKGSEVWELVVSS